MVKNNKPTPLGELTHTDRGFEIIQFQDKYHVACQLQQSSLAEFEPPGSSAIWLGVEQSRMHLDLKQVKALICVLEMWVQTGAFAEKV